MSWEVEQCNRARKVNIPAVFNPDLEIIDDEDDEDEAGGVWCLQHQGCGQKGLVVRATNSFFSPTKDIMEHHRKGENNREKYCISIVTFKIINLGSICKWVIKW